jgi:hypothetical protein
MAVEASAYAAVRGFPKRLAGEDFYLLDKLAKVAPIWRDHALELRLRSRASLRTAHGTGVSAVKLAAELHTGTTPFYHPQIFPVLGSWLTTMDLFAEERDVGRARTRLRQAVGVLAAPLEHVLTELGAWRALELGARQSRSDGSLRKRLHTWFDGFRTLKLVHGLRARGLGSVPFREALAAPWCITSGHAPHATVDELRRLLAAEHTSLPPSVGLHARDRRLEPGERP